MNLPESGTSKEYPNVSKDVVFRVGNELFFGNYIYTNNKFRDNNGINYYCDEVIEWWPMPEIGTGVQIQAL